MEFCILYAAIFYKIVEQELLGMGATYGNVCLQNGNDKCSDVCKDSDKYSCLRS